MVQDTRIMDLWSTFGFILLGVGLGAFLTRIAMLAQIRRVRNEVACWRQVEAHDVDDPNRACKETIESALTT